MPRRAIALTLALMLAACATAAPTPAPPAKAPAQPNTALLEFIGNWTEDERELLNMDEQNLPEPKKNARTGKSRDASNAGGQR